MLVSFEGILFLDLVSTYVVLVYETMIFVYGATSEVVISFYFRFFAFLLLTLDYSGNCLEAVVSMLKFVVKFTVCDRKTERNRLLELFTFGLSPGSVFSR